MTAAATISLCLVSGSIGRTQSKFSSRAGEITSSVPFVGCEADGQTGPTKAPPGASKRVVISTDAAGNLAYYKSEQGLGILAPRGWNCFGVYGSNGYALYVSPEPLSASVVFSNSWKGFTGPAIRLYVESGDTSGRFAVARVIARVFPSRKSFVDGVIAEGIEPASSFPYGPYPADKLKYRNQNTVEYETPANSEGLGTYSRLQKSSDQINGVAILVGETPDLLHLAVRLAPSQSALATPIILQLEAEAKN